MVDDSLPYCHPEPIEGRPDRKGVMTFANMDGLLILGMLASTASLWLIFKSSPAPVRIKKENRK